MNNLDFWYNEQFKTYLKQFIRAFSGFQIETGIGRDGTKSYIRIPVLYADRSRMVGYILQNNSANVMNSCPFMTIQITNLEIPADRRQNPQHISNLYVTEREFDNETQDYTGNPGNRYMISRHMPVPYNVTIELAIWTSLVDHKLQIFEQILSLFNPSIDIQTSINILDWSGLTYLEIKDVTWSDRTVPQGTDTESLDVAKISFECPILLNPPAQVKRQKLIHQIVTNIIDAKVEEIDDNFMFNWMGQPLNKSTIIAPQKYSVNVFGNIIKLIPDINDPTPASWRNLLDQYGKWYENTSHLILKINTDVDNDFTKDMIGTFTLDKNKQDILYWTVDPETLPTNTLPNIDAIIDPTKSYPGNGLPISQIGQRYLLIEDINLNRTKTNNPWIIVNAKMNDIIENRGDTWVKIFDSTTTKTQYITNNFDGKKYTWTGAEWIELINGEYFPGFWRIRI